MLADRQLAGDLGPTWPYNVIRHARGCLHAAAGDYPGAVRDLLETGEIAQRFGIWNPALLPWRSGAALSLSALGDREQAVRLCAEEVELAKRGARPGLSGSLLRLPGWSRARAAA